MQCKRFRFTDWVRILRPIAAMLLILGLAVVLLPPRTGLTPVVEAADQVEGIISLNPASPTGAPTAQLSAKAVVSMPKLERIFTLNTNFTLTAIDERTNTVIDTVAPNSFPEAITADEARGLLYVLTQEPSSRQLSLVVYEADILRRIASVALDGFNGRSLIFDAERNVIYAVGARMDPGMTWTKLWAIDGASRNITGSATYQGSYRGMALDAATGRLLLLLGSPSAGSPSVVWLGGSALAEERRVPLPIPSDGNINDLAVDFAAQRAYFVLGPPGAAGLGLNVLDLNGGGILAVVPLGLYPDGVAFDSRLNRIFVLGNQPGEGHYLVAIDANTHAVLRRLPLKHELWSIFDGSMALDPTRSRLYVPSSDGVVAVIDTGSYEVRYILLSHRLGGLAFDDQRNRLYVASMSGDAILVVDPTGRQIVGQIQGVGALPEEVAVDTSLGRIYVLSENGRRISVASSQNFNVEANRELDGRVYSLAMNPATHRLYALMVGKSQGTSDLLAIDGLSLNEVGRLTLDVSQGPAHFSGALGVDAATNRVYVARYPVWVTIDGATLSVVGEISSPGRTISIDSRESRGYQFYWCDAKSCGARTFVVDLRTGNRLAQLEDVGPVVDFNSRLGHAYTAGRAVGVLDVNTFDWVPLGPRADRLVADEASGFLYALSRDEGVIRVYRDRVEPSDPSIASLPVAKVEIVWPHDQAGQRRGVIDAPLANVGAALFQARSFVPLDCTTSPRLTLWSAQNGEPGRPVMAGSLRHVSQSSYYFGPIGQLTTPVWDFNDVDVRASQSPENKTYFWLSLAGRDVATNVWSHAADARTYLPIQVAPSNVVATAGSIVDARIQILWPHDEVGNERQVAEANLANIGIDLFESGTTYSVPPDWNPTVRLYRSLDNGPQQPVGTGRKGLITVGGVTYPRWFFDDVDVSAARNPDYRHYFRVAVDGVTTHSSIWVHGVDGRTIFPQQDVPVAGCR